MSQEKSSFTKTSQDNEASRARLDTNGFNAAGGQDLSKLLDRCQDDLIFMDSVLKELENASQHVDQEESSLRMRVDSAESISKPQFLHSRIANIGAASIHRMANDIEELCRTGDFGDVQTMLGNLQSKMAHCLRLLPANETFARSRLERVAD